MLPIKKDKFRKPEPEREIFDLDRSNRVQQPKKSKKIRVRLFDMVAECLRGKGYVEMEVPDEEDAFKDTEKDFGTINIKEEDI